MPALRLVSEKFNGVTFPLDGTCVHCGRAKDNDLVIPDAGISARHCMFQREPTGGYTLCDCDSTNGTLLNHQKIQSHSLKNGDLIKLGAIEMLYEDNDNAEKTTHTMRGDVRNVQKTQIIPAISEARPGRRSNFGITALLILALLLIAVATYVSCNLYLQP